MSFKPRQRFNMIEQPEAFSLIATSTTVRHLAILLLASTAGLGSHRRADADTPVLVVGAAADVQYEDRVPGPHPDDIRRWYDTAHIRLDGAIRAWNARPDIDLVMHLGDIINAQWESFDVVFDYADGTDYDPDLLTFRDLNVPSYQLVGNHEFYGIQDDPHPEGEDDLHVRERLGLANNLGYYELRPVDGYRFVILDDQVPEANPARPGSSFGLGHRRERYFDQQMQWARRMVADAYREGEKVILYQHYPMSSYYNNRELNTWEEELASIIETYPNVVAHFSGHFHSGPGKTKNGVLFDTLGGTLSADPELDQNIWYVLEFYDDRVVVDQFGENFYLDPDEDDKEFFYRDHTAPLVCDPEDNCQEVTFTDFNGDGDFDGDDLVALLSQYGQLSDATLADGDAQGDQDVDGSDFLAWQRAEHLSVAPVVSPVAVPEPSSMLLLGILMLTSAAGAARRHR